MIFGGCEELCVQGFYRCGFCICERPNSRSRARFECPVPEFVPESVPESVPGPRCMLAPIKTGPQGMARVMSATVNRNER